MLECTNINYYPIEFIKQILINSNISNKIWVDCIISNTCGINIIR